MDVPEVYVSTDIETNGPTPGLYSMLSFASAAYTSDKTLVSTFSVNLKTLPKATEHPATMAWWRKWPEAWKACRENCQDPEEAMLQYTEWLKELPGQPVFVGYPVAFDFPFISWYLYKYVGENPFAHSAIDIKSYAMAVLQSNYSGASKDRMPDRWFDDLPHTHIALDDALEQGSLFCNMLQENMNRF